LLDGVVDLGPVDREIGRGVDAQANFVTANVDDDNDDIVAQSNSLILLPAQN